jgi:4-hydroxy-tetrahydrodipicolinate reductase
VIRVGVLGAAGRMGREVCRAVADAEDLDLVARIDPAHVGGTVGASIVHGSIDTLATEGAQVAVDFTQASAAMDNARWCLAHGVHIVIGTTGLTPEDLEELRAAADAAEANAVVAPNFAIGAVLMMRFAAEAARYFDAAEVIELHHDRKTDAPSGTAIATARAIAEARSGRWHAPGGDEAHPGARGAEVEGVRVHGIRLPGLVAHQEVLFGGPGQTLTIRHDSTDRSSFMPGVLLAIRTVAGHPGLTVGIDHLLA